MSWALLPMAVLPRPSLSIKAPEPGILGQVSELEGEPLKCSEEPVWVWKLHSNQGSHLSLSSLTPQFLQVSPWEESLSCFGVFSYSPTSGSHTFLLVLLYCDSRSGMRGFITCSASAEPFFGVDPNIRFWGLVFVFSSQSVFRTV